MADNPLISTLSRVPLFRDVPHKSLERLSKVVRERTFKPGEAVVKEGEEGVGFFMITEGEVAVVAGDPEKALGTLKAGDFFGEMALLDSHRRSATVRASVPTKCLALSRWDFAAEVRANPDLAMELLTLMSRRVRELDERLAHD
ncbi:MAG: cyclic nucleotide-binding domain-containing protein [Chloroflexi bacterium]|nr:cyclic nucleotide-binding domain-containing protein [Chloroflexota bacterium]